VAQGTAQKGLAGAAYCKIFNIFNTLQTDKKTEGFEHQITIH